MVSIMPGFWRSPDMPPVDLLIRTAGEQRISNFLLWQSAGAEFQVSQACWPDFRRAHQVEHGGCV